MKIKFLFLTLLISSISIAQKGNIIGTLTDKEVNNNPLTYANVAIKGTSLSVTTDDKGKYKINIDPGNYTIVFSFIGYESVETIVTVKPGETLVLNKALSSGGYKLEDVTIKSATKNREKETALLLEQKKAVEIKQSIGAQEMSRKGISDVEEGLTKITGITKVDGRGLFVRGLEDRYNNLLINGLAIPSNNPFKKIIPLDIFPTDIVSVLETYKTFNTNLYGDFAGGTFNIVTSNSGKSLTKVNIGAGYTTNNNLQKFLISKDAKSTGDFFGFSGNERDIPKAVGTAPANYTLTSNEALKGFGSGFDVNEDKSPLNTNFGILHTQKFKVGNSANTFQYLLSLNYENKYQIRNGVDRFFNLGSGLYDNNLVTTQYKFATNSSILGALNYKTNRLTLSSNTIYLNTTENTIQDQLGYTNGNATQTNGFIRLNQLLETTYLNTQLSGKYKLSTNDRHNIKAGVSFTKTNYQQPDRKSFKGIRINENTTSLSYTGNSIARQYFDFEGKSHVSGLLEYSWNFGKKEVADSNKLTIGYNGYMNKMQSSFRFLVSENLSGANSLTFPTNTLDNLLANDISNSLFTYKEGTNATYKAKLDEIVNAGYADLAFKFGSKIELNLGIRAEQTNKETLYKESGDFDAAFKKIKTNKLDFLPSVNTKYKLNEKSNLRFAASKTITRPVIMEAYPLEFVNPDGTIENGNKLIKNSENYNVDLKYELFPSSKELVSVTAFSKIINNPIERIFLPSAGSGGQNLTYDNSKKALLYGVELEFLFQLEKISKSLSNFSFGANASIMDTKVTIDPIKNSAETVAQDANATRKLQGASPFLFNTDLKYESKFTKSWKNTMTLVYNIYSKRIYAVGTNKLDNYYEMPYGKLDFIWGNNISEKWDLKLSIDNILNPNYKIEVGNNNRLTILENDFTMKQYKKGIGFSFNLAYTF